jgi:Ion transport protein
MASTFYRMLSPRRDDDSSSQQKDDEADFGIETSRVSDLSGSAGRPFGTTNGGNNTRSYEPLQSSPASVVDRRGSGQSVEASAVGTVDSVPSEGLAPVSEKDASPTKRGPLYIFKPISDAALFVIKNPLFDAFIVAVIILNSLLIASASYTNVDSNGNLVSSGSLVNTVLNRLEVVFTSIFVAEFGLKALGLGLFASPDGYFLDPWNWLDFVIVVTS